MWSFLNNEFVPEEKACLPISDLSIQRGYGVFDFFKVVDRTPVFLKEHLDRFYFSAGQMHLDVAYLPEQLEKIIIELILKNQADDTGIRITLTGGNSPDGMQLSKPNLAITMRPFSTPAAQEYMRGIRLVTYEHQRQFPQVKTIDYLMSIWLQPFIQQQEADDVLYYSQGRVTECPRSNFFIVTRDNRIITPGSNILKGIVRTRLIELAKINFEVEERELPIDEVKTAREAFITSTTKTILPVRQIDEYLFPGENEVTKQLHHSLLQLQKKEVMQWRKLKDMQVPDTGLFYP